VKSLCEFFIIRKLLLACLNQQKKKSTTKAIGNAGLLVDLSFVFIK
jgi:hypothetical protein